MGKNELQLADFQTKGTANPRRLVNVFKTDWGLLEQLVIENIICAIKKKKKKRKKKKEEIKKKKERINLLGIIWNERENDIKNLELIYLWSKN